MECSDGYTYVDLRYPMDEECFVDTIYINNSNSGTNFRIGVGSYEGTTFTPRIFITIATTYYGQRTYYAPAEFTGFTVYPGEYIYLYSDADECEPNTTNNASPEGIGWVSGDKMGDVEFSFSEDSNRTMEVQLIGTPSGWSAADVDKQDPGDVEEIDGVSLSDIETVDGL